MNTFSKCYLAPMVRRLLPTRGRQKNCRPELPPWKNDISSRMVRMSNDASISSLNVRSCNAATQSDFKTWKAFFHCHHANRLRRVLPQTVAPPKRLQLLCFSLKNGSFNKTFGSAPPEEPKPELKRSPAKQTLTNLDSHWQLLGVKL